MAARAGVRTVRRVRPARGRSRQETDMPRYLVHRTFPEGLAFPTDDTGHKAVEGIVEE